MCLRSGKGRGNRWAKGLWSLTSVACVHVCNEWRSVRIEVCNHLCVGAHVVEMGDTEIWLTESRGCGSGSSLCKE